MRAKPVAGVLGREEEEEAYAIGAPNVSTGCTRAEKGRLKRKNPLENQRVTIKMAEWKGFEPLIQVYARILA